MTSCSVSPWATKSQSTPTSRHVKVFIVCLLSRDKALVQRMLVLGRHAVQCAVLRVRLRHDLRQAKLWVGNSKRRAGLTDSSPSRLLWHNPGRGDFLPAYARHLEDLSAAKRWQRRLLCDALGRALNGRYVGASCAFRKLIWLVCCAFRAVVGLVCACKRLPTFPAACRYGWLER
jgi:hypothetical protein